GGLYWYNEQAYNSYLSDKSRYMDLSDFSFYMESTKVNYTGIKMNLTSATTTAMSYDVLGIREDGTAIVLSSTTHRSERPSPGILITWDTIHSPGSVINNTTYEFGAISGSLWLISAPTNRGDYYIRSPLGSGNFIIPFKNISEYNAAVGLTYEPLTLTEVADHPTVVSGSEVN
ncbi:MAG: hypothetical protein K2G32_10950, partial [Oscillospiraceae bacterium]|nr:hypothetical protein [Oscillospiraceae bacterium]